MTENAIIEALSNQIAELKYQLDALNCVNRIEALLPALAQFMLERNTPHFIKCEEGGECAELRADKESVDWSRYYHLLTLSSWLSHPATAEKFSNYLEGK